jgi:formamidopyrimidine-DNA glycosylase
MPELPEVETTVRAISGFENSILEKIVIHNRNLRWEVDKDLEKLTANKRIYKISRRAKYIIIKLDVYSLMLHLGMSGKLRIQNKKDNYFKKHDHVEFVFKDKKIIFNDVRRFGSLHITKNINDHPLISNLGIEPLSRSFNKDYLHALTLNSKLNIKKLLMDQKKVVGVGNIYASESLFLASINPLRPAKKISLLECDDIIKAIKKVLKQAIKMGGTTLKDFYSADGSEGYFKLELNVYGLEDKPCKKCKRKIKRVVLGQRSTFFCENCQV